MSKDFSNRIDFFIKKNKLSVREVAERLGISASYLYNLIKGHQRIHFDMAAKMAFIFRCYPSEIMIKEWQKPSFNIYDNMDDNESLIERVLSSCDEVKSRGMAIDNAQLSELICLVLHNRHKDEEISDNEIDRHLMLCQPKH